MVDEGPRRRDGREAWGIADPDFLELFETAAAETGIEGLVLRADRKGRRWAVSRKEGREPRAFLAEEDGVRKLRIEEDRRLPGTRLLRKPRRLAALLGLPEPPPVEVLAWRPFGRAVLRCRIERCALYLKLFTRKGFARVLPGLEALRVLQARLCGLQDPRPPVLCLPLRRFEEEAALLLPEAPGRSLHEVLGARGAFSPEGLAASLEALHRIPAPDELPSRTFEDERRSTLRQLRAGALVDPSLAPLLAICESLPLPDPGPGNALVHTDLHDKQIYEEGGAFTWIDIENAARGDPLCDLVNLLEHIRLRELQAGGGPGTGPGEAAWSRALGIRERDLRVRSLRILVRARLAGVYAMRPQWQELSARLAAEALALPEWP